MRNYNAYTHGRDQVPSPNLLRSTFKRNHKRCFTADCSYLYPIFFDEILPGDTIKIDVDGMVRLQAPFVPILDDLTLELLWFYCDNRLLWDNWVHFQGERVDPSDDPDDHEIPQMSFPGGTPALSGSLADYLGLPVDNLSHVNPGVFDVSALPFRMYNLIYNTWFRDQQLIDSVQVDTDDGPDDPQDYVLLRSAKPHDYFTSATVDPQLGDAIELPLGTTAPVQGTGKTIGYWNGTENFGMKTDGSGSDTLNREEYYNVDVGLNPSAASPPTTDKTFGITVTGESGMIVDLSDATAANINDLRLAFKKQRLLELDNIGGTRYPEILKRHFDVEPDDRRRYRPEFLGASKAGFGMNQVLQSSESGTTSLGTAGAASWCFMQDRNVAFKTLNEHGLIMAIMRVRAKQSYHQGIDRYWHRLIRYDFYEPILEGLGDQAILNKEIFHANTSNDDLAFGYAERWSEYKRGSSKVMGLMRPGVTGSLAKWNFAQHYTSLPTLNAAWIHDDSDDTVNDTLTVTTEPQLLCDFNINIDHTRIMHTVNIPNLGGPLK